MSATLTQPADATEAMAVAPSSDLPSSDDDVPYLFTNEQYFQMIEADVFPDEARVYLWEGRILQKMAKKKPHETAGAKFNRVLVRLVPPGWYVNFEASVVVGPGKVPLPDLLVIRGEPDDNPDRYTDAPEVGLLIELAYTSLKRDLGRKMQGDARAGFPTYWVVDLMGGTIIEHRDPVPDQARYATVTTHARGGAIPLILDGVEVGLIPVDDLLPRA
jgi:Uma2 family endonuclease